MKEFYCQACGRKHNGKHCTTYCRKHQYQLQKYGKLLDSNPRNKFDPNEFRYIKGQDSEGRNDYAEFDTYKSPSYEINKTYKVDVEDVPKLMKYKWNTTNAGYAKSATGIFLHRMIMNAIAGQQVDHINLDVTDNRKCNLRIANNSLNSSNRAPYNKLNIKGVEYHEKINKYSAYFRNENKQYHSACYNTAREAIFARYILEQMFRAEFLTQFENPGEELSEDTKKEIIDGLKKKFNK